MRRLTIFLAFALALTGCTPQKPNVTEARAQEASRRAETAKLAATGDPSALGAPKTEPAKTDQTRQTIVATIGDSSITVGDVLSYIERQPREMQARYSTHEQRKKLLQHLIDMELLAREAKERGLDANPIVRQTLKQSLARQLLAELDAKSGGLGAIEEAEVRAFYDGNRDVFVRPARRRAAWLMSRTEDDAKRARTQMMAVIAENPKMARQVFGDFVVKHSIDGETKALRGDLGWFFADGKNELGQVRVDRAGTKATFALASVNSISEPTPLDNKTWALLQLTNEHPEVARPFDEVQMDIQNRLMRNKQSAQRQTFIEGLKAKATIEIHEAALATAEPKPTGPATPRLRLPNPAELKALSLGRGVAPSAKPQGKPIPSDPKLRLHPSATRHGLIHRIGKKPLGVKPLSSRAERATVEEIQEKMRRDKAGE
jgi:peptidyl-prolyl cis-trans isomerase C